jgi:hypothetical protein
MHMSGRDYWDDWERDSSGLEVTATEMVVTTACGAEVAEYAPLSALLQRATKALGVELAFVSEWCGEPVLRERGEADAFQPLHGRRYLERSAAPGAAFRTGALRVDADGGKAHGTLCFRAALRQPPGPRLEDALEGVARLIATWLESATG